MRTSPPQHARQPTSCAFHNLHRECRAMTWRCPVITCSDFSRNLLEQASTPDTLNWLDTCSNPNVACKFGAQRPFYSVTSVNGGATCRPLKPAGAVCNINRHCAAPGLCRGGHCCSKGVGSACAACTNETGSPTCFTGNCAKCSNSSYALSGGVCNVKTVVDVPRANRQGKEPYVSGVATMSPSLLTLTSHAPRPSTFSSHARKCHLQSPWLMSCSLWACLRSRG